MLKIKKIKKMVAKSGPSQGKNINVVFLSGRVPGTRANYSDVAVALGVSREVVEKEAPENTATFILTDAMYEDFAKNCGADNGDDFVNACEGLELEGVAIRMEFNPDTDAHRGVQVVDRVSGRPFKIATFVVREGQGGLVDNRHWEDKPIVNQSDIQSEADLTAKRAAGAATEKV